MLKKYNNNLEENLLLLSEISELGDNFDSLGAVSIPSECVTLAMNIIQNLPCQPLISPTGRGTVYLQYEHSEKGFLGYEVFNDHAIMCRVGGNCYQNPHVETISKDIVWKIRDAVAEFIS